MGSQDRVAIVVDSAVSLPSDVESGLDLHIVPMQLNVGGRTYRDGADLEPGELYRLLDQVEGVPTTSAPSPADFLEAFTASAADASSILCITVSPRFSATHDSAQVAAQVASVKAPETRIELLDSESAAGGEGLIALEALRVARGGASLDDVLAAARAVVRGVSLVAYLDTLYYVWKGGRVPRIAYLGTTLLKIKPVFELDHGEVRNLARPRTGSRASDRMLEVMRRRVGDSDRVHATVMHADAEEEAERLQGTVESEFRCEELFVSEFSPVMGAHTGPGLLGIAFWAEEDGE